MPKYKMREWYSLCCYFLPAAIAICADPVDKWDRLMEAYICLLVAIRVVAGFRPESALDQVRGKQSKTSTFFSRDIFM
jgi:hypothetical protein